VNPPISPKQASDRIRSLETDMHHLYLTCPSGDLITGPNYLDEYDDAVEWLRAAITTLSKYVTD